MINERDRCKACKGKKVQNETKILEVHVDKGMKDTQKIYFRGEGDQQVQLKKQTLELIMNSCFTNAISSSLVLKPEM